MTTTAATDPIHTEEPVTMNSLPRGTIYGGPDTPVPDNSALPSLQEPEPSTSATETPVNADTQETEQPSPGPENGGEGSADGLAAGSEPEKPFRHKTQEEAEASYRHAQVKLTKLAQENADLKKAQADREQAEAMAKASADAASAREAFFQKRFNEAADAVAALDEYAPDYKTQAARVWADCHRDIAEFKPGETQFLPSSPVAASTTQDDPGAAYISAVSGPGEEVAASPDEIKQRITSRMEDKAVSPSEFDITDPVFYGFAVKAPIQGEDGKPLSFEDQVDWAIEKTRAHYTAKRSAILQTVAQPMGRAGSVAVRTAGRDSSDQKLTLNAAVASAIETRRLV